MANTGRKTVAKADDCPRKAKKAVGGVSARMQFQIGRHQMESRVENKSRRYWRLLYSESEGRLRKEYSLGEDMN